MKSFQHERGAKQRAAVQRRENAGGEANAKVTRNGSGLETGASRSGPGGVELLRIEKYTLTFAALLSNFSTPCRMSFAFRRGLELWRYCYLSAIWSVTFLDLHRRQGERNAAPTQLVGPMKGDMIYQ